MGECRIPGSEGGCTLRMRPPPLAPEVGSTTYLKTSPHPFVYRISRHPLAPRGPGVRRVVGTDGVTVTVGADDPPPTRSLSLPDELAVMEDLAGLNVPVHFEHLKHLPSQAFTFKILAPVLAYDERTGLLTGTAVMSIPEGQVPERKAPTDIDIQFTIRIPRSPDDLKDPPAHVQACYIACVETTIDINYNRDRLAKLVGDMSQAWKDANQSGVTGTQVNQVVLDVQELVKDIVSLTARDFIKFQLSGRGPLTRLRATVDPISGTTDYRLLGFNLIPKGLLEVDAPALGVRGNRILGHPISYTGAFLVKPTLSAIAAGDHWTSQIPAYVYGEVSYAKKVASGLQLGFKLTAAIEIWERAGLKPDVAAPQLFAPLPPGTDARNVPGSFRSERGEALKAIKDGLAPGGAVQPYVMFSVGVKW